MSKSRKPSYGAATRVARLILGLVSRPAGWSFTAIEEELRISEKTLLRYVAVCEKELVDDDERPLLEVFKRGSRRHLRLRDPRGEAK